MKRKEFPSISNKTKFAKNPNRFFPRKEKDNFTATQTVTVNVNIDNKDDCLTACFKTMNQCKK